MSDGYSIGLLIMCALYTFAPQFIEEGRLHWLRSPLYIIKNKNQEHYFFSDEEYARDGKKYTGELQRNKGLGSLTPEQARNSMFLEENQHLDKLIPDENSYNILYDLMGDDASIKHDFIFSNLDFSIIRE